MPAETTGRDPAAGESVYRFGEFEVRPASGELFRDGARVRIQAQSLQILLALLENPGAVVSREQLRERLWPEGTFVDFEHSINAAMKRLRAVLKDDADRPRYIETLPKHGYRLIVEALPENVPAILLPKEKSESALGSARRLVRPAAVLVAAVLLLTASMSAWLIHRRALPFPGAHLQLERANVPRNGEAYELYLRSLGYKFEPPANGQAVTLLERSVELDSRSAPSWNELARRYRTEFELGGRGQGFFEQAREANRRALELDPDFAPAKMHKVILDVEGGQKVAGYREAAAWTRAHPDLAYAHYALSFALRWGGLYKEAAQECDIALKLDSANSRFHSCSLVFILLGRYDRARMYIDLDSLSVMERYRRMDLAILTNDKTTALETIRAVRLGPRDYPDARLMEAALSGASPETVQERSREAEALYDRISLPEAYFVDARHQSWAGQTEAALRLLRRAIATGYCSFPVMDSDPMLANARRLPEYAKLRQEGVACRESFQSQMKIR